jgi:CRISPR system Cascade subunit CasD
VTKSILLLRLEGPLQSWGSRARWDVRDTQPEPTKSGVVGLLGCALGYGMGDRRLETELDSGLRFGVRIENPGRITEDYQTITDFLPTAEGTYKHSGIKTATSLEKLRSDPDTTPSTIISPRFYLEDAAFLIALEETESGAGLLARCADALTNPIWPVYLGRKACVPTRPILDQLTEDYESIEDALNRHPWSWLGPRCEPRVKQGPARLTAYVEDPAGMLVRQDTVRINAARQYGFRSVRRMDVHMESEAT